MKVTVRFQILLALFLAPVLIAISFIYEHQNSVFRIRQYVGIWEDDIAEALLMKQDSQLLEKIRSQLSLVVPAIEETKVIVPGGTLETKISSNITSSVVSVPLSLNLNPVGEVIVVVSNRKILWSSLLSPVFGLGLLLMMGFSLLFARREVKLEIERSQLDQRLKLEKQFSGMALQVAHDIRSPLMAVTTVVGKQGAVSEEVLPLLKSASERIHEIAEDLLARGRSYRSPSNGNKDSAQIVVRGGDSTTIGDGSAAIEALLPEFKIRFPLIHWTYQQGAVVAEKRFSVQLPTFERMVSNILQNAAEAIGEKSGSVSVEMFSKNSKIFIRIQDSGKGIPENVIQKLLNEGGSFNKQDGNGLGLKNVRENLAAAGGLLKIQSSEGFGTLITLEIPLQG